ncbi:hypothetical protein ACT453_46275, partial [Bacillus sp. D-CC]
YCKDLAPALAKFIPYPFDKNVSVPEWIDANNIETVFYQALAFIILFIITKIALSLLGNLLNMFAEIPVLKQALDKILSQYYLHQSILEQIRFYQ